MANVRETPLESFRRLYREDWSKFLKTPMGSSLIAVVSSQMPMAIPDTLPHKEAGRLGEIRQWQMLYKLLVMDLVEPIQVAEEVLQDYPDEKPSKTEE